MGQIEYEESIRKDRELSKEELKRRKEKKVI